MNEVIFVSKEALSRIDLTRIENLGIRIDPAQFDFIYGYPPISTLTECFLDKDYLKTSRDIGVYIHIPFCDHLCNYCYFHKSLFDDTAIDLYVNALIREIKLYSNVFDKKKEIKYLYFGGGTPNLLSLRQIENLIFVLKDSFIFSNDIEITFEGSPNNFANDKIKLLKKSGVNRISIGVQTFNTNILKSMNRNHDYRKIVSTIENILTYFPDNFNIDLIYGYPGMNEETIQNDLKNCINLEIPSITTYQLWTRINSDLSLNNSLKKEDLVFQKIVIAEFIQQNKYYRDKSDWFLKTDKARYKFQNHKWKNGYYIGIGSSSYAYINENYYRNSIDINEYIHCIDDNKLSIKYSRKLSKEDVIRRYCALSIKINEGIDLRLLKDSYNTIPSIKSIFHKLEESGLAEYEGTNFRLTSRGFLFPDNISELFFSPVYREECIELEVF